MRSALVCGQVAVAIVLVITAVTLARNGSALGAMDVGFATDGVISVNVRGEQDDLARPLAEALAADPRVGQVAVTSGNPLFNSIRIVAASAVRAPASTRTLCSFVSPEFFSILRIPISRGRGFRDDEARAAARVAIVSAATAAAFWPGEDPIGKTIKIARRGEQRVDELPEYPEVTVVGTVRDIVTGMMMLGPDRGHIYLPMNATNVHAKSILARGRTDGELTPEALQEIFKTAVADPQVFEALPLGELRDLQVYPLLAASWIGALLGAVALALSVSGLYGVLTYALSQRRKEIGIRMALGATARSVIALVLRHSARLAGIGAAIGTVASFAALTALSAAIRLRNVSFLDIGAFAAGVALVMAAALLAAYAPARRASRVDPSQILHIDG